VAASSLVGWGLEEGQAEARGETVGERSGQWVPRVPLWDGVLEGWTFSLSNGSGSVYRWAGLGMG
jgi:hypothetical protein